METWIEIRDVNGKDLLCGKVIDSNGGYFLYVCYHVHKNGFYTRKGKIEKDSENVRVLDPQEANEYKRRMFTRYFT